MHFVKGLANSTLTYVPNMIHICPNTGKSIDHNPWQILGAKDLHFLVHACVHYSWTIWMVVEAWGKWSHLPLQVLFLFYLYMHVSNSCMQSIIYVSHKDALMSFSRICVRIDFIVFNKWIWVEWFMISLLYSFVYCGFVIDCQRGRLLGHMWVTC